MKCSGLEGRYLLNGTYDDFSKIRSLDHHPPFPQNHHQKSTLVLFEFCQKHPTTPFFNKKSTRCTFRILPKTPYPPPLFKKKNVLFCKKFQLFANKGPLVLFKISKNTYTIKYDGEVHRLIRSFSITYFTNFYSEVCIMNMLLSQAI